RYIRRRCWIEEVVRAIGNYLFQHVAIDKIEEGLRFVMFRMQPRSLPIPISERSLQPSHNAIEARLGIHVAAAEILKRILDTYRCSKRIAGIARRQYIRHRYNASRCGIKRDRGL